MLRLPTRPRARARLALGAALALGLLSGCGGGSSKATAPVVPGVPVAKAGAEGQLIARAALAYVAADARGRGARTCTLITTQLRATFMHRRGRCAKALTHPPVPLTETTVSSVQITASTAIVYLPDPGLPLRQIALVKEGGRWRVSNGGT